MKQIKLNKGYFTIVDDEDYDQVAERKWFVNASKSGNMYAYSKLKIKTPQGYTRYTTIKLHRLLLNPESVDIIIDHIDGNGLNNQKSNLRLASKSQNGANRSANKITKSSNYKGVSINIKRKSVCWRACCRKDKKRYVKYFSTEVEAALWYNQKAIELHGEFSRLNVISNEELSNLEEEIKRRDCITARRKTHRICLSCEIEKELSEFIGKIKKTSVCKNCCKIERKSKKDTNNIKVQRQYRQLNRKIIGL